MKQKQIITPLSQWPTEAILYLFRKHRQCYTEFHTSYYERKNKLTNQIEIWLPVGGSYQKDDGHWDYDVLYYELYNGTKEDFIKQHTTTYGCNGYFDHYDDWYWPTDEIWFRFEGMYWKGTITDVKKELAKRPNCNIHGAKDFRKWKMNWKKNNKR